MCLRRNLARIIQTSYSWSGSELHEDCAVVLMLSVPAFEVFVNGYFGVRALEAGTLPAFIEDARKRGLRLYHKLEKWIPQFGGTTPDLKNGRLERFLAMQKRRNDIVHYWSELDVSHTTGGTTFQNMANTGAYHLLTKHDAWHAYFAAEGAVREVFDLMAQPEPDRALFHWAGVHPLLPVETRYPWGTWVPDAFNERDNSPKITSIN